MQPIRRLDNNIVISGIVTKGQENICHSKFLVVRNWWENIIFEKFLFVRKNLGLNNFPF